MKKNVHPMVTGWIQTPHRAFDAERGVNQRKVLGWRIGGEPNSTQAVGVGKQTIVSDVSIVVPNEAGIPCGLVGEDDHGGEQQRRKPGWDGRRSNSLGTGWRDGNIDDAGAARIFRRATVWPRHRVESKPRT